MTLLRPNFRPESWAQNAGNGISGVQISKNFRGGMPPDTPSIASISAMIPSDLRLDPPLKTTKKLIGQIDHLFIGQNNQLFLVEKTTNLIFRPPPFASNYDTICLI